MFALNQFWTWTDAGGVAPPTPAPEPQGGSAKRQRRERRRSYVEIDGEVFFVNSPQEAQELFRQARELAEQEARRRQLHKVVRPRKKAAEPAPIPELPPLPKVAVFSDEPAFQAAMQAEADKMIGALEIDYLRYQQVIDAMRKKREDDDEDDAMMALLLD